MKIGLTLSLVAEDENELHAKNDFFTSVKSLLHTPSAKENAS